jgi:RHS repeat-associated protein
MCYVDLPTGRLSLTETDVELPGLPPLVLTRHYRSTNIWEGDLGFGWGSSMSLTLRRWRDTGGLVYRGADGRRIVLEAPTPGHPSVDLADRVACVFIEAEALQATALSGGLTHGAYAVQVKNEDTRFFDTRRVGDAHVWRGLIDVNDNVVVVEPDVTGLPGRLHCSDGRLLELVRDTGGRLTQLWLVEPSGTKWPLVRYTYDAAGNLTSVVDAAGMRAYEYDGAHQLIGHRDRSGGACLSMFGPDGRCVETSGPGGARREVYDYEPGVTRSTDATGRTSTFEFSTDGLVTRATNPEGQASRYDYDVHKRLVRTTDPAGHETTICYGAQGLPVAKVAPDGSAVTLDLGPFGLVRRIISAEGVVKSYGRDEKGRVTALQRPGGGTVRFVYAGDGSIAAVTTPTGRTVKLLWDNRTRLTELDDDGPLTVQTLDAFGRITRVENVLGGVTEFAYSDAGFLSSIRLPDGATRRFEHDALGRITGVTDEEGAETRWSYDQAGRCLLLRTADGAEIRSEYDAADRVVAVTDPSGLMHRYAYNAAGRVVAQQFFDGRVERYEYDAAGRLATLIDPAGDAVRAERDPVGTLRCVRYPDGTEKLVQHDLDQRWIRVEWDGQVLARAMDDQGQAVREIQNEYTVHRRFGAAGLPEAVIDSFGRQVSYVHDADGRLVQLEITPGQWTDGAWQAIGEPRPHRFRYDRAGNRTLWETPGGKVEERLYDGAGHMRRQVVSLRGKPILTREYTYDLLGRVVELVDSIRGRSRFAYDVMRRLAVVDAAGRPRQEFRYDPTGELIGERVAYEKGHRLRARDGLQFEYDGRGFVRQKTDSRGVSRFEHTTWGLIRRAVLGDGKVIEYTYDGHWRLLSRQVGDRVTRYHWNAEQVWSIRGHGGSTDFVYDPNHPTPFEAFDGEKHYSLHSDHRGRILEMIDDKGTIAWSDRSDVWGVRAPKTDASGPECPFGDPGQIWDADTGLYYNRHRFYCPQARQYLTPDPIGLWGGLYAYAYVLDPVNQVDPLGLKCRGKTDDPTLYRSDSRPPDEICKQGFAPQNPSAGLTIAQHVEGVPAGGSNWVSTSHSKDWAEKTGLGGQQVYVIDNPGCGVEVDCDPTLMAKYGPDPPDSEHEIAFDKAIPASSVKGFFTKGSGGLSFTPCP